MQLTDHGQIAVVDLPEGWVEKPAEAMLTGIGTRSVREFHRPDDPQASICFYYRGLPLTNQGAAVFRTTINRAEHALTTKEIEALREVLKERAEAEVFAIAEAKTLDWNGRRVLWLTGQYRETGAGLIEILVDCDGTGRAVQEVYFHAPAGVFERCVHAAEQALRTIQWKQNRQAAAGLVKKA